VSVAGRECMTRRLREAQRESRERGALLIAQSAEAGGLVHGRYLYELSAGRPGNANLQRWSSSPGRYWKRTRVIELQPR
jgi:hypothetical protein